MHSINKKHKNFSTFCVHSAGHRFVVTMFFPPFGKISVDDDETS